MRVLCSASRPSVPSSPYRQIISAGDAAAVLVLTMSDDDGNVFAAMRAGATGYVLKGAPGAEIVESLRVVASGRAILASPVAERMIRYFDRSRSATRSPAFPQLSARETEVLGHPRPWPVEPRDSEPSRAEREDRAQQRVGYSRQARCAHQGAAVALARDAGL
ncbi:hypothetical protein QT381_02920 [Galbitalea sp. SE-J8]|nr:hypothetical protein [Galbitalea sp. SE-J8]MDM4761956.1 hypothetical protein [Galbitalea sp. SE-J8]